MLTMIALAAALSTHPASCVEAQHDPNPANHCVNATWGGLRTFDRAFMAHGFVPAKDDTKAVDAAGMWYCHGCQLTDNNLPHCQPVTLDNADTIKGIESDLDSLYKFRAYGKGVVSGEIDSADGHGFCYSGNYSYPSGSPPPPCVPSTYQATLDRADVRAVTNYLIWRRMHDLSHYCVTYTPPKGEK